MQHCSITGADLEGKKPDVSGRLQQLSLVILLNPRDNYILKQKYSVTNEYDYISNSIYKTSLACDAVSDEILLRYHYRCHEKMSYSDLFYTGRFDFVVYEKIYGKREITILAIELDGMEHYDDETVKQRDRKRAEICRKHGFELIRIENSYAKLY